MRRAFFCCAVVDVSFGCGRSKPSEDEASPSPSGTRPTATAESAKVREYKANVAHYLEECRVAVKLFDTFPSGAIARAKAEFITDLYTRIPDAPPEIDADEELTKLLGQISVEIDGTAYLCKLTEQMMKATKEEYGKALDNLKKFNDSTRNVIVQAESLLSK